MTISELKAEREQIKREAVDNAYEIISIINNHFATPKRKRKPKVKNG